MGRIEDQIGKLEGQIDQLVKTVQIYAAVINVLASKIGVTDDEVKANLATNGIKILEESAGKGESQPNNSGDQSNGDNAVPAPAGQ